MLKRITMTKKVAETLSATSRTNKAIDKVTKDIGDITFYTSADGKQTYVRVWDASADAGNQALFFEVSPMLGDTKTPLDAK